MVKRVMEIGNDWEIKERDTDKKKKSKTPDKKPWDAAEYLNIGWYLVSPLLLGVLVGFYLDRLFGTKPFFILSLIFLGFIASIYNLWKLTKTK